MEEGMNIVVDYKGTMYRFIDEHISCSMCDADDDALCADLCVSKGNDAPCHRYHDPRKDGRRGYFKEVVC